MMRLRPSLQPLPDNIWHTVVLTALASAFLWLGWEVGVERFRSGEPLTVIEQHLLQGEGHPLYVWMESELTDSATPWIWNRTLSGLGWASSLFLFVRLLTRRSGFLSSLSGLIVLTTLPGLGMFMCTAGSGSWGLFFFLMATSALLVEGNPRAWLRAGMYAAAGGLLNPLWLFPACGLLVGTFEAHRLRLPRLAIGFGAGLAVGVGIWMATASDGLGALVPGGTGLDLPEGWAVWMLRRHFFLAGALALMLGYGLFRRGTGWWCLVGALAPALFAGQVTGGMGPAWVPLLAVFSLGLSRLPALIDLRHPRAYQSVLLCQLLLWVPAYLGNQSWTPYDGPKNRVTVEEAVRAEVPKGNQGGSEVRKGGEEGSPTLGNGNV